MRLYLSAGADALRRLRDGAEVSLPAYFADSDDEDDEHTALLAAAEEGGLVVVADVDDVDVGDDQSITLEQVVALHVDADGSGHLAWFGTQELDAVLDLVV